MGTHGEYLISLATLIRQAAEAGASRYEKTGVCLIGAEKVKMMSFIMDMRT